MASVVAVGPEPGFDLSAEKFLSYTKVADGVWMMSECWTAAGMSSVSRSCGNKCWRGGEGAGVSEGEGEAEATVPAAAAAAGGEEEVWRRRRWAWS